jgi:hypothetical protein
MTLITLPRARSAKTRSGTPEPAYDEACHGAPGRELGHAQGTGNHLDWAGLGGSGTMRG